MQIHATNISGLGASQVVISFLESFEKSDEILGSHIYLPQTGALSNYKSKKGTVKTFNRYFPNGVSRFLECFFSKFLFPNIPTIVLGDIPLRGIKDQIVLVHQPNLVYPRVNDFSSRSIKFRVNRFLFLINNRFAKKIIVQTGAMASQLINSYTKIKEKVLIIPQPAPNWLDLKRDRSFGFDDKVKLFYPAAVYAHKKHDFLLKFNSYCVKNNVDSSKFEIWLTLTEDEFEEFKEISFIKNLGRLNAKKMNLFYQKSDALLFLSSMESYGFPLIEALTINLPIITVDFPYSKWLCENEAYYFEPYKEDSLMKAISLFCEEYKNGKLPDYYSLLLKFPRTWDEITFKFYRALFEK